MNFANIKIEQGVPIPAVRPTSAIIYGIFEGDRCVYVGKTLNFKQRCVAHKYRFRNGTPKILRKVSSERAARIELATIRRYKRLGEAEHNKYFGPRPSSTLTVSRAFRHKLAILACFEGIEIWDACEEIITLFLDRAIERAKARYLKADQQQKEAA